jgi:3-methylfumaryl-CoA hydratase
VHGPLIATLLVDEARRQRPGLVVRRFAFKAVQPLFDTEPFSLCCRFEAAGADASAGIDLWARGQDGRLAMSARIEAGTT